MDAEKDNLHKRLQKRNAESDMQIAADKKSHKKSNHDMHDAISRGLDEGTHNDLL